MNLVIDIGNTQAKVAIFDRSAVKAQQNFQKFGQNEVQIILEQYPKIKNVIISCVGQKDQKLIDFLRASFDKLIELTCFTSIPFENLYKSKETLGVDRLAAVAGANVIFPGSNVLVVDAGTAIKYELMNDKNQYLGGNISPGLQMRFKALNFFTNRLPFVEFEEEYSFIGNDTKSAIIAGVQNGIIFEMEGTIDKIKKQYPRLEIILTGGDANYFVKKLKYSIFADSNLVLIGLNRILEYNVQTE